MAGPSGPAFLYNFYPRSPCGERPLCNVVVIDQCHFYPRSPCGERRRVMRRPCGLLSISIHALLAESDLLPRSAGCNCHSISIHALLAESDHLAALPKMFYNISIHALLAESDARRESRQQPAGISIHALLAESDLTLI